MAYTKPSVPSKYFPTFLQNMPDLTGKTFVITGTTSGTGKVAAHALASKGARVFMLNRPSPRSEKAQHDITTAYPTGDVQTVECDLQSFASVQSAADKLQEFCTDGIYALINNAGIMAMPDQATGDGFDTQMQTNHLSHFLLTRELFPLLEKGADKHGEARVVNHSSMARKKCPQTRCQIPGTEWWQLGRRWLCAKRRRSMGSLWTNQTCQCRIYRCFARQTPSKSIEGQIIGCASRMGKHRAASQH